MKILSKTTCLFAIEENEHEEEVKNLVSVDTTLIQNFSVEEESYRIIEELDEDTEYSVKYLSTPDGKQDVCIIKIDDDMVIYLKEHKLVIYED